MLIDRGDLEALVALGLELDTSETVLWHPLMDVACAEPRAAAVQQHASLFSACDVVFRAVSPFCDVADAGDSEGVGQDAAREMAMVAHLVDATATALALGCRRVIWPVRIGPAYANLATLVERIDCVLSMASVGCDEPPLVIQTPLLELTAEQVVDLADDQNLPVDATPPTWWPCATDDLEPCGSCATCVMWRDAFDACGVPWPMHDRRSTAEVGAPG